MRASGSKERKLVSEWDVVCSYGQMVPGMKGIGEKEKHGDLAD